MSKNEIKKVSYRIDYIGDNPPSLEDVEKAIVDNLLDEEDVWIATKIKKGK